LEPDNEADDLLLQGADAADGLAAMLKMMQGQEDKVRRILADMQPQVRLRLLATTIKLGRVIRDVNALRCTHCGEIVRQTKSPDPRHRTWYHLETRSLLCPNGNSTAEAKLSNGE
jgi:hypothetical protein